MKFWKNIWKDIKNGNKANDRNSVDELNNRWGSISDKNFSKLLEENPKKFKRLYPDFYEFVTSKDIQETAGRVSGYAQSGIGEFIAETYAEMIRLKKKGEKLPEDILLLFRKYFGPEIPD